MTYLKTSGVQEHKVLMLITIINQKFLTNLNNQCSMIKIELQTLSHHINELVTSKLKQIRIVHHTEVACFYNRTILFSHKMIQLKVINSYFTRVVN